MQFMSIPSNLNDQKRVKTWLICAQVHPIHPDTCACKGSLFHCWNPRSFLNSEKLWSCVTQSGTLSVCPVINQCLTDRTGKCIRLSINVSPRPFMHARKTGKDASSQIELSIRFKQLPTQSLGEIVTKISHFEEKAKGDRLYGCSIRFSFWIE